MDLRTPIALAIALMAHAAFPQASLTAFDAPLTIDFVNTVEGVNNGPFAALAPMGGTNPQFGELDTDAWDYVEDGSLTNVAGSPSTYPGILPAGVGVAIGGSMATGVNATTIGTQAALGIQPTGGHFTAGSLTLRVQNNTAQALEQLAVAYTVGVYNDRDRSNFLRLYWSATNGQDSYVAVPGSEVISPPELDDPADWDVTNVSVTLTGFSVPVGSFFYLRWVGDDVSGSGQRDEFAITDITLTAQALTAPVLTASVNSLSAFVQQLGTPSPVQSFTVSGSGLTDDVAVSVDAPFEVSINAGFGFGSGVDLSPTAGVLNAATLYVRLNNNAPGASNGAVTLASAGVNTVTVALTGTTLTAGLPTLYLNELQADNTGGTLDPFGEADDWFEVYNPNGSAVDLAGWYVSDSPSQLTKYRFHPDSTNAVVPAHGWLLVWADGQVAQGNLHTNFSLSSTNGEDLLLVAPDGITIVDQVSFGPQAGGVSYGRATDGGTPWVSFTVPTPGASNNPVGIGEAITSGNLIAWPVPTNGDVLHFNRNITGVVYDAQGSLAGTIVRGLTLPVAGLVPGIYFLRTDDGAVLRFVKE